MIRVDFVIVGHVMMPEGTTTNGKVILVPDGKVLGPAVVFEDLEAGEDLTEGDIADLYKTEVNYNREVVIEE